MEHLYIVCYDIGNDRRWRKLYKKMHGYGEWMQLSVFQCRLNKVAFLRLQDDIRQIVNHVEDHVLIMDLGPAENVIPKVMSIGAAFVPIERRPVIV